MSDTALYRLVDGERMEIPRDEAATIREEWATAEAGPARWDVPKLVIIRRLAAVGKLRAAYAALKLEAPIGNLTDAELALRESWNAADVVYSDEAPARALFAAIGADPDEILARP